MKLPRGDLVQSRVVASPAAALADALNRRLDGYLVLEPQDTLLFEGDEDGAGVVTLDAGVPVLAYHLGTDRGGVAALTTLAGPGPFSADLYAVEPGTLADAHENEELRVTPGAPAERLADDATLASRTRDAAPKHRLDAAGEDDVDPLEAFLADTDQIAAIQEQAEAEAARRAEEWGLTDVLDEENE
ncbi:hypothetical protein [Haloarchaeobius sp. DFWS5]|uniref:hypothetical protein n=1 Tax=Haloarchaeobius sp. DFWS5 TaxID=3446114 RepID=UPI003EBFA1DD